MSERLSMMRALLDNPSSNPTAIIMGIVIIVLALLLLVVILLLWALPRAGAPVHATAAAPRPAKRRRAPSARQRIIGTVLAWIMLLGSLAAAYTVTSDSAYCGTVCRTVRALP
jgi:amino acid transporter